MSPMVEILGSMFRPAHEHWQSQWHTKPSNAKVNFGI